MNAANPQISSFPCDLCGSNNAQEIAVARHYTNGQPLHVCRDCGFVYVRERRSAEAIATAWSDEIFGDGYTARIPAVQARLTFVAEFAHQALGLRGKALCDIGAGEGEFLKIARRPEYGAKVFGIEPSRTNCRVLDAANIECFHGTIEAYSASRDVRKFDVATVMWTLENCQDCRRMLDAAYALLNDDNGHIVVATGSRLLVPFKKPLHLYLSGNPADTHCFRFSANTLRALLAKAHFETVAINRYIDQDWLCVVARKAPKSKEIAWHGDDPDAIIDFFERWHDETQAYYKGS